MNAPASGVTIRGATDAEVDDATAVFDAAMLEVDADRARALADDDADGAVLAAVDPGGEAASGSGDVLLGALALDGNEITALAVRPRRRGQGIGSALVRAAGERTDRPLVAAFDADLRPFYERLGFTVERVTGDRHRGLLDAGTE